MKVLNFLCAAGAACVLAVSCTSKEEELYNQIKTFPSSDLIAQYQAECPDGEHIDSVKTYYAAVVGKIQALGDTADYQAYLNLVDSVSIDSVKAWALVRADTLLLDSINKAGTTAMCETYLARFPKSKNLSVIQAKQKELKEQEEKQRKDIDRLLNAYASSVRNLKDAIAEQDMELREYGTIGFMSRQWCQHTHISCDNNYAQLQKYKDVMTPEQLAKMKKLRSQYR